MSEILGLTKYDKLFLNQLKDWEKLSHAKKRQVACIITKNDRPLVTGYNGTLPGFYNECEDEAGETMPHVIHAEMNAISYAAKTGISLEGATLYCSLAPCTNCAKLIILSGIKKVLYNDISSSAAIDLLGEAGVKTVRCRDYSMYRSKHKQ